MAKNNNSKGGFSDLGKGVADMSRAAVAVAATGASVVGSAGRAGGNVVSGTAGLAGRTLSGVSSLAMRYKPVTFLVGLYAGLKTVQHFVNKHKEKKAADAAIQDMAGMTAPATESYDPRAFDGSATAPAQNNFQPVGAPAPELAAEQQAVLRELLAAQAGAPAPQQQAAPAQGNWARQIDSERAQQGQSNGMQV